MLLELHASNPLAFKSNMQKFIDRLIEAQFELAELAQKLSPDSPLLKLIKFMKQPLDLVVSHIRGIDADLHDQF